MRTHEDHHVHSTFSDGSGTPAENLEVAEARGLTALGFADHVRHDSDWLDIYVSELAALRRTTSVQIIAGVEAKVLDTAGAIDLPPLPLGIDRVLIADHQLPTSQGPLDPRKARDLIRVGALDAHEVVETLVHSTANAVARCPRPAVVAHLFSVLPKAGIDPASVPLEALAPLIDACLDHGAAIEIDERWRCPSVRIARAFWDAGVDVLASTDSHKARTIGRYKYALTVADALVSLAA